MVDGDGDCMATVRATGGGTEHTQTGGRTGEGGCDAQRAVNR